MSKNNNNNKKKPWWKKIWDSEKNWQGSFLLQANIPKKPHFVIYSNKCLLSAYKEADIMHLGIFFLFETGLANGLTTCFINPGLGPHVPAFNKCRCNSPAQSTKMVKENVACGHSKTVRQVTEVHVVWGAVYRRMKGVESGNIDRNQTERDLVFRRYV